MTASLKNHWIGVAFIVHCGETLARVTSRDEPEPAWHRLAINQALACAKARAMIGGPAEDDGFYPPDGAIVLDGQYFDHYDIDALSEALCSCLTATRNTAAEVNQPEADLLHAATGISGLAMRLAFYADERDLIAATISWMSEAGDQHAIYAERCLEALVAAEKTLELLPDDAVPECVWNLLSASALKARVEP